MATETKSAPLMAALNFTADDLAANRDGRLSAGQRARLQAARRRGALVGVALMLAVVLLATVALYLGQINRTPVLTFVGVALTICGAVVSGLMVRNWYRLTTDLERDAVQTLAGTVQHTVRVSGRVAEYVLAIDGQRLSVPKPVFLALKNGGQYRLYRTPIARVLLAGEAA